MIGTTEELSNATPVPTSGPRQIEVREAASTWPAPKGFLRARFRPGDIVDVQLPGQNAPTLAEVLEAPANVMGEAYRVRCGLQVARVYENAITRLVMRQGLTL
jgi:hypothetical protein